MNPPPPHTHTHAHTHTHTRALSAWLAQPQSHETDHSLARSLKRTFDTRRYPNIEARTGRWQFLHAQGVTKGGITPPKNETVRVLKWATADDAHLHGYWAWDWADTVVAINQTNTSAGAVLWAVGDDGPQARPNARFIGVNLLSELDVPNE
jgi:hypothetical protein